MSLMDLEAEFYRFINSIIKDPPAFFRMMRLEEGTHRINALGVTNSVIVPISLLKDLFRRMDQEELYRIGTMMGRSMTSSFMEAYALELSDLSPVKRTHLVLALATTHGWGEFRLRKFRAAKRYAVVEVVRPLEMDMPLKRGYVLTAGIIGGMLSRCTRHELCFNHTEMVGDIHTFTVDASCLRDQADG